jgi:hypothetical protein
MATRARIGLELDDGSFISSYQHWDGYPGGLGYMLIDHWSDYKKVKEAIELGDASVWRYTIGESLIDQDTDIPGRIDSDYQNVYYMRDKGEKDANHKRHLNGVCLIDEAWKSGEDYLYVYKDIGKGTEVKYEWFYMKHDDKAMKPLFQDAIKDHIRMLEYHLKENSAQTVG